MKEFNIKLTVDQLNLILESLGQQSYMRVFELIENIQTQVKGQLNGSAVNGVHEERVKAADVVPN